VSELRAALRGKRVLLVARGKRHRGGRAAPEIGC
jgi:hypothetical protein